MGGSTIGGNSPYSGQMSESVAADPVWLSKEYLLKVIMEQCEISTEDLRNPSLVKNKVRDSKIITVLSK